MPSMYSTLYTVFTLLTLPARLVTWWLWYIPTSNRPNPAWSWKTAVAVKATIVFVRYKTVTRHRTPKTLDPGAEGNRFIVLNPQATLNSEVPIYKGTLTSVPAVQPVPIGAVWYPATPVPPPQKLVIHFHPSAFVLFGPRLTDGCSWGPTKFGELSGWPVLSIQYRLSLDGDKTTFPAAIQDALTAYIYALETLKILPSQIVFSGESAGGNIVLALLRYLSIEKPDIPLPRCGLLWSPWVDLREQALLDLPKNRNYNTDYLEYEFGAWGRSAYVPAEWSDDNPYLSPLGNEYQLSVPLYLEAGTSELLYEDLVKFAHNLKEKGTEIEFHEVPNGVHTTFGTGEDLGMPEAGIEGHARGARFIARVGA